MDKLEEKIENSKKLPKEEQDKIDKIFFINNVIAIVIMIYFALINVCYYKMYTEDFIHYIKLFAVVMAVVSVGFFEQSYRKEDLRITLVGIETLICAILAAYIPYVYIYGETIYREFIMILPILFAVYYLLKTVIVLVRKQRKYRKEAITDIKEILDDSIELESYIDDNSSAKLLKKEKEAKAKEKKLKEEKNKKK